MTDFCKIEHCQGDAVVSELCFSHAWERGILPNGTGRGILMMRDAQQNGQGEAVKRQPVSYRWDGLNWDFIKGMAQIAYYADSKYGSSEQYTQGRLEKDKSPINHAYEHLRAYQTGELHDHFKSREAQLWAIAYNAMMEFYYLHHGGPTVSDVFYTRGAE